MFSNFIVSPFGPESSTPCFGLLVAQRPSFRPSRSLRPSGAPRRRILRCVACPEGSPSGQPAIIRSQGNRQLSEVTGTTLKFSNGRGSITRSDEKAQINKNNATKGRWAGLTPARFFLSLKTGNKMQTLLWLKSNKEHKRTSRYLGLSWDAKRNALWAKLNANGRRYDLGLHSDQIFAARAYNEMAAKFGRPTIVIEEG
jgi:hypothetical protein